MTGYNACDMAIGYLLALIGVFSLASATGCTQAANGSIPITQIILGQSLTRIILCLPIIIKDRSLPKAKLERCLALGGAVILKVLTYTFYYATKLAPAGAVQALYNSAGMVTCIIRDVYKKRKCSFTFAVPLILCLIGLVLTTQPTFLGFEDLADNSTLIYISPCHQNQTATLLNSSVPNDIENGFNAYQIPIGYTASLIGGMCHGLADIITVEYLYDVHPNTVNFWIGSVNSIVSMLGLIVLQKPVFPTNYKCWLLSSCINTSDALGSSLLHFAVLTIFPTAIAILLTLDIVIVTMLQYTILRQIHKGHENWEEYVGLVVLMLANVLHPVLSWRDRKKEEYKNLDESTSNIELK